MTALATSPFLTFACGIASRIHTTITSPTDAYLRLDPPRTLMHMTFLAPELSATSRIVCIWTMVARSLSLLRLLDELDHAPTLVPRERARLDDLHRVARLHLWI